MKILNQAQAEAVYSAMCALNNVGGLLNCRVERNITVTDGGSGGIVVFDGRMGTELYDNQAAFAAAYGLDGEPEMVEHLGLSFKVLAKFPEADSDAANAYMEANPNAGLLCIENGIAYLVDMADEGVLA